VIILNLLKQLKVDLDIEIGISTTRGIQKILPTFGHIQHHFTLVAIDKVGQIFKLDLVLIERDILSLVGIE
jgi:hypothetical protein